MVKMLLYDTPLYGGHYCYVVIRYIAPVIDIEEMT